MGPDIPPAVQIEVSPVEVAPSLSAAMVDACTSAIEGRCARFDESAAAVEGAPRARVQWLDDQWLHVRIAVTALSEGTETRKLTFEPEDAELERHRAVGLIVAAMVEMPKVVVDEPEPAPLDAPRKGPAEDEPPKATPPAEPEAQPATPAASPEPKRSSGRPSVWVDGRLLTGPVSDEGRWQLGGELRGAYGPPAAPWLVVAAARYGASPATGESVTLQLGSAGLGAGLRLDVARDWTAQGHVSLVGEVVAASATDGASGEEDGDSRLLFGSRGGIDLAWQVSNPLGLVVGLDGSWVQRGTSIRVRGDIVDRVGPVRVVIGLGARWVP